MPGPSIPRDNPFTPGAGLRPPHLGGRAEVIDKIFHRSLDKTVEGKPCTKDIILYGPRGVGKTCLLGVLEERIKGLHHTEPDRVKHRVKVLALTAIDLNTQADVEIELMSAFGQSFWKQFIPGKTEINLLPIKVLYERKTTPFSQVREAFAERSRRMPVFITIDEAHTLDGQVFKALSNHSAMIRKAGGALAVVFSGKPHLLYMANESGASFGDRFEKLDIGLLDTDTTMDVIRIPFARHGIAVDDEVLLAIAESVQGYPHFAQIWGERLWERCRETGRARITHSDFSHTSKEVWEERRLLLQSRHRLWKGVDEALLAQINARLKSLRVLPDEAGVKTVIKEALRKQGREPDTFDEIFDKMIESDYVWQEQGKVSMSFSLPSFVSYITDISA